MTPDKLLAFLNKGGLLGGAIVFCTLAYRDMSRMQTDIDKLQAVVIDCYQERVEDLQIKNMKASGKPVEHFPVFAILPDNPVGRIKEES